MSPRLRRHGGFGVTHARPFLLIAPDSGLNRPVRRGFPGAMPPADLGASADRSWCETPPPSARLRSTASGGLTEPFPRCQAPRGYEAWDRNDARGVDVDPVLNRARQLAAADRDAATEPVREHVQQDVRSVR
jgi:hypothetical protein